jgi:hypothetical protein
VGCGRGADAKGRLLRPAGKGSEGSFVLLSLITHHEILRIGSPSPATEATEQRCTASSTGAAARRTSHVAYAPNLCNRECSPAARRLGQQLVAISRPWPPSSTAQHSVSSWWAV